MGMTQSTTKWPYPSEINVTNRLSADVVVLGGGIAGCMAAIAAAKKGQSVILVDKGAVKRSGAGGSGAGGEAGGSEGEAKVTNITAEEGSTIVINNYYDTAASEE